MSDFAPDHLPSDFEGFDKEQPEELPADFAGFDGQLPDELPAGFAGFDQVRSPASSVAEGLSPPTPERCTAQRTGFGSQLLAALNEDERNLVMSFAQTLGATVADVIPRSTPDPVFPRGAPHDWETWLKQRNDRIFARGREGRGRKSMYEQMREVQGTEERERQQRKDWLVHQRRIGHGWARWMRWRHQFPQQADDYRREHQDADGADEGWLIEFAAVRLPRKLTRRPGRQE